MRHPNSGLAEFGNIVVIASRCRGMTSDWRAGRIERQRNPTSSTRSVWRVTASA